MPMPSAPDGALALHFPIATAGDTQKSENGAAFSKQ